MSSTPLLHPGNSISASEPRKGLYDPSFEHDACGVGVVADIRGRKSHDIVQKGLEVLIHLGHRGACGSDPDTGDGAGLLMQMPHDFFRAEADKLGAFPIGGGPFKGALR